jgi:exosome complex component RRP4
MSRELSSGDVVSARIATFDRTRDPILTVQDKDLGKIPIGELLKISATRVPRLIGKRGSMIQTIEHATSTRITIGQNGLIVVSGKNKDGTQLAIKAIRMVEEEAHTSNLTQRIKQLLGVEDNVQIDSKRSDAPIDNDEGHDDSMLGDKKSVVQSESESPSRDQ